MLLSVLLKSSIFSFYSSNHLLLIFRVSKYAILKKKTFLYNLVTSFLFRSFIYFILKTKLQFYQYILFFIKIKNVRGMRHIFNLPVNGQRSKTNASTRRRIRLDVENLTKKTV